MASGLCIVATRSAADGIWQQDADCGAFVKTPVPEMIGQLLKELTDNPTKRLHMQRAARRAAARHNWDVAARQFEQHVAVAIGAKGTLGDTATIAGRQAA